MVHLRSVSHCLERLEGGLLDREFPGERSCFHTCEDSLESLEARTQSAQQHDTTAIADDIYAFGCLPTIAKVRPSSIAIRRTSHSSDMSQDTLKLPLSLLFML